MRVAGEFVLICATYRQPDAGRKMCRAGYCFNIKPDFIGVRVKLDQEPFFAQFNVELGGRIDKSEGLRTIDEFYNPTEVEGPDAQRAGFNGDDVSKPDFRIRIRDPHPT